MDGNEVLFCEHHAAAQSLRSAWTRLASTYGCMKIELFPDMLIIKPHWFAKWLISLFRFDLCHEIPITNIIDVLETGKWAGYGKVELKFLSMDDLDQKILLYMKKYSEFIDRITGHKR